MGVLQFCVKVLIRIVEEIASGQEELADTDISKLSNVSAQ